MDVTEDVVLRMGTGNGEEELFASQVTIQVGISRTVGNEEVDIGWDSDLSILKVGPCRYTIELDVVELYSIILQINDTSWNQIPRPNGLLVEDAVVVARNEDSEFSGNGYVPGEEVLQVGRIETFTSISGTDEDVSLGWYSKPPIHPVGIGESKDCMPFEWNYHSVSTLLMIQS